MDKSEWQILNIRLVRLIDYYYYTFPPPLRLEVRLPTSTTTGLFVLSATDCT